VSYWVKGDLVGIWCAAGTTEQTTNRKSRSAGRCTRQGYSRDLIVHLPCPRSGAACEVRAMSSSTYSSLPKFHEAAADAPILLHRGKSRHYTACAAHDYFAVLCRLLGSFGQPIVDRSRP
jgi:hypothetical protein